MEARGAKAFYASADAYDRHIGRYSVQLAAALCDLAGVQAGQRALDVGCGPGALTTELADRLGPGGVTAVDPSEPFAEACRARVPGVQVSVAPAEALPFEDSSFDVALAQLVVNFMTDARAGVAQMRRVTCTGGVVGAAVWDYAGEMTLLREFWDAAVALDPAAAEHHEGLSISYGGPDSLGGLWEQAGLAYVGVSPLVVAVPYSGFDDLWQPLEAGVGPSGAYAAALEPAARAALHDELRRRLDAGHGPFRLSARAWGVVGRVSRP